MRKLLAAAATLLLLRVAPAEAALEVVTIHVPVKLSNLAPALKTFSIQCQFQSNQNIGTGYFNRVDTPLVNGGYNGTVTMALSVDSGYAGYVTGYACKLYLFPAQGSGYEPTAAGQGQTIQQAKPNTPFVPSVSGKLP